MLSDMISDKHGPVYTLAGHKLLSGLLVVTVFRIKNMTYKKRLYIVTNYGT